MKKVKVLHVGLSSNVGGIETVVRSWLDYQPEWIEFDFVNVENKGLAFQDDFQNAGSKIYKICSRKKNPIKSYIQLKNIIKNGEYDFVHHHIMGLSWPETVLITNRYSKGKTKGILHAHTIIGENTSKTYRLWHILGKIRLRKANYLQIACCKSSGDSMFGNEDYSVIENGVNLKKCAYSIENRKRIREAHNIGEGEFVIGHVGRACYEKNYPFIIRSFKKLLELKRNARLLLIGNIDKDETVQKLIREEGLEDKVICTGYVKNPKEYYSAMDVFYLPSHYEGLSVALVEAQASGLPCVVSRNVAKESAISEYIEFIPIDTVFEAVNALIAASEIQGERENRTIDPNYNIVNSSQKMYEFYKVNSDK